MLTENIDEHILYDCAIIKVRESIWLSLFQCNGLIKIDTNTGMAQFVDCFDDDCEYPLHFQIVLYKNKLFFVPLNAKNIAIYDLDKKIFRYVPAHKSGEAGRFSAALEDGKFLYMVSCDSIQVVQVDMDLEKVVGIYELEADYYGAYVQPIKLNDGIYKISGVKNKKNLSWKFDFETRECSLCKYTFAKEGEFVAGCMGKDCIWIIDDNNILYKLSEKLKCMEQYDISTIVNHVMGDTKVEFLKCICFDNVFIMSFYDRNCIFKIPLVKNIPDIAKCEYMEFDSAFFPDNYDDLIIMLRDRIIIINNDGEREITFNIDAEFFSEMISKNGNRLKEIGIYGAGLNRYIEYVCDVKDDSLSNCSGPNVSIGKKICDTVK